MRPSPHPTRRSICLLALVAWLVLAALPHTAAAQPAGTTPTLDLAALVLMPADLDAEGMPGYGTEYGQTLMTIEEMANPDLELESRMWMIPADVPNAMTVLNDAGWVRYHELLLATPVDPDDPDWFHSGATSSIEEYASPEGASTAFATFTSEPALRSGHLGMVEFQAMPTHIGNERVLARHTFIDAGDTIHGLTLMVRLDTLIVSVTLADYGNGLEPDMAALERLTVRLVTRVQAARDAGAGVGPCLPGGPAMTGAALDPWASRSAAPHMPGLDRCVQRLIGDDTYAGRAYYVVLDGVAIRFFGESEADLADSQAKMTSRGIQDYYQNQYPIEVFMGETYTYVNVTSYTSEAAAAADFAGAEQRRRAEPGYSEHTFTSNPLPLGDESWSLSMRSDTSGNISTMTYVRFDHIAIGIRINGTSQPVPDIVNALLTSQVACMQANDCTQPIPVPPGLIQGA